MVTICTVISFSHHTTNIDPDSLVSMFGFIKTHDMSYELNILSILAKAYELN